MAAAVLTFFIRVYPFSFRSCRRPTGSAVTLRVRRQAAFVTVVTAEAQRLLTRCVLLHIYVHGTCVGLAQQHPWTRKGRLDGQTRTHTHPHTHRLEEVTGIDMDGDGRVGRTESGNEKKADEGETFEVVVVRGATGEDARQCVDEDVGLVNQLHVELAGLRTAAASIDEAQKTAARVPHLEEALERAQAEARALQARVADMAEDALNAESPGAPAGLGDTEQVCRAVVGAHMHALSVVTVVCGHCCLWSLLSVVTVACGHCCLWSLLSVVTVAWMSGGCDVHDGFRVWRVAVPDPHAC